MSASRDANMSSSKDFGKSVTKLQEQDENAP